MIRWFLTFVLTCMCLNSILIASENISSVHYVTYEQVLLTSDGIFVMMEGDYIPVRSISYTEEGYYCFPTTWTCPKCQTVNPWYRTRCKKCKY